MSDETTTYFVIDSSALFPGDIVLTRNPESPLAIFPFTHAFISTRPPECVESADFGVVRFVLDRFLLRNRPGVKVLRLKDYRARTDHAAAAAEFAAAQVTREYASIDVWTEPFPGFPALQRGKYFCSQLVAQAYESVHITLVPGRRPHKVSPWALALSPELDDVTDQTVREAREQDLLRGRVFLDGPSIRTPHAEEVEAKQRLIAQLQPKLRELGVSADTYDDALILLVSAWQRGEQWVSVLDDTIALEIRNSGLLDQTHKHFPPDHPYFFIDLDVMHMISTEHPDRAQLETLQAYFQGVLEKKRLPTEDLHKQVHVGREAFAVTGLEAVRLNLALLDQNLAVLERESTAVANCLRIIQRALEQLPAA